MLTWIECFFSLISFEPSNSTWHYPTLLDIVNISLLEVLQDIYNSFYMAYLFYCIFIFLVFPTETKIQNIANSYTFNYSILRNFYQLLSICEIFFSSWLPYRLCIFIKITSTTFLFILQNLTILRQFLEIIAYYSNGP